MASSGVVGFLSLGSLSLDIAYRLLKAGFRVQAFEEDNSSRMDAFLEIGGDRCDSCASVAKDVTALIVLSHEAKVKDLLFGKDNILKGLHKNVVIILQSTSSEFHVHNLEKYKTDELVNITVVGLHVFKGASDALMEKLIAIASGQTKAIHNAQPVISAIVGENLYVLDGEVEAGSKLEITNALLEGIHLVASVEAMYLGVRAGIHPLILYDIISNAAGSSWIFVNKVPYLLNGDKSLSKFLNNLTIQLDHVMYVAKSLTFPLPLLSVAYQQLLYASSSQNSVHDAATPGEVWDRTFGIGIRRAANESSYDPRSLASQVVTASTTVKKIGFIGLGAMGFGMASHLLRSNFHIIAYDVYAPTLARFVDIGGMIGASPAEVSADVEVLIIMVANEAQAESVLFGSSGAIPALPAGAFVILSSTVSPGFMKGLEIRLNEEDKCLKLVDAPVSGGVKRAADGTLTIMASGTDEALAATGLVLSELSENLYVIKGGCGAASSVKMVNQLLAGVHIAAAAEALAFGSRLGLDTRILFEIIKHREGFSWMFGNRVPHILDDDYTPLSAIDIFVKDLGIVSSESSNLGISSSIASAAHQLFLSGSALGFGRYDDSAVVKVYETLTSVKAKGKSSTVNKADMLKSLPPEWPEDQTKILLTLDSQRHSKVLIVLDDDPTGTQTVHDIEVLTEWNVESIVAQFSKKPSCFFILTNSRSLSSKDASLLIESICKNINIAASSVKDISYTIVLRGDSTLRGHFPEEPDAVVSVLGELDAWVICPFFLQGGRFTIDDVHYVADSERLIPAGDTEFAKDASFGYKSSNLREWVEEKTRGRIGANSIVSISIPLLRVGGPSAVCKLLCSLQKGSTCVVNAASERDIAVFAAGMLQAETKGKRFLCRTAASFVSARLGIGQKPPVHPHDLGLKRRGFGGLIVVGSYVPKTTSQLMRLKSQLGNNLKWIEISVEKLAMSTVEEREDEISFAADSANASLRLHQDTLLVTSRQLVKGKSPSESLEINSKISSALVEIVRRIEVQPRYILAKGGITSSDIATKGLDARLAKVVGQALAGVPLWQLGPESRYPGVPYIVFPGNVGDENALAEVVKTWACSPRTSTRDLLLNADRHGYAVGAFNVYNLEGVEAVVAAAEAENSPAILQVHSGALKHGGAPLVACCISAALHSRVPIAVHFDHASSKPELVEALELGFDSVMVDGSHLPISENISLTKYISVLAHSKGIDVEAELGRLSGTEDDLSVEERDARLTDCTQAREFIDQTGIDALAVCIGNVHGKYPADGPNLRFDLLKELHQLTSFKGVKLVLHGASGLSSDLITKSIDLGVRKFNVNTEVRNAYLKSLRSTPPGKDLVNVLGSAKEAMVAVVAEKMRLFGSSGKAWQ